jgi:hypothetical protein
MGAELQLLFQLAGVCRPAEETEGALLTELGQREVGKWSRPESLRGHTPLLAHLGGSRLRDLEMEEQLR